MNATKRMLAQKMSEMTGQSSGKCEMSLEFALEAIKKYLESGYNVQLRGFGSFNIVKRKQKIGRVITRNESIVIPERNVIKFKPSFEVK